MHTLLRTSLRIVTIAFLATLAFLLSVFVHETSQDKGVSEFALSPGLQNAFADAPANPPPPFTIGSAGSGCGGCGSSSGSSGSSCP